MVKKAGVAIKWGKVEIAADDVTLGEVADTLMHLMSKLGYPEKEYSPEEYDDLQQDLLSMQEDEDEEDDSGESQDEGSAISPWMKAKMAGQNGQ